MRTPHTPTWLAALACGVTLSTATLAQATDAPQSVQAATVATAAAQAPAQPQLPAPNPEAAKAVQRTMEALVTAVNQQSTLLDAKHFTDSFNEKITAAQLQQVLSQLHQIVGNCSLAGQVQIPISFVGSYLLSCDKAFVPVEVAVEEQAPYRIHTLLIRPSYSKL